MKYGLIYYKDTENLGDDILSYAGKRFLPHVDYYIDREAMDLFVPEEKEYVAAILNGWYIHNSYAFPPSPYLLPLFVGTHFNTDVLVGGGYFYLNEFSMKYLKKYEPIGCRDTHTMEILMERSGGDLKSYFSGCLTLTLPKYPNVVPSHEILLTDVSEAVMGYVKTLLPDRTVEGLTHLFSSSDIGWTDWQRREARVEAYLRRYQSADFVVTRRLHCALPCIALGTPVILIVQKNKDYQERIESFVKYCVCCTEEELLSGQADWALTNPPKNGSVEELVRSMEKRVQEFIDLTRKDTPDVSLLPERSVYQELFIERGSNMRRMIQELTRKLYEIEEQYVRDMQSVDRVMELVKELTRKTGGL